MKLASLTLPAAALVAIVACSSAGGDDKPVVTATSTQAIASTQPAWSGWGSLGGGLSTDPSLVAYDLNHMGAFATSWDLYFNWFDVWGWQGWVDLGNNGNPLWAPPVAARVGNHLEVFVIDSTTGHLLHKEGTFNGGAAPTWSAWESLWTLEGNGSGGLDNAGSLSTMIRPPTVVVSPNNQINVFARFDDGVPRVITGTGFGSWGLWTNLGGATPYQPGAVSWGPNRLDVFVTGTDAQVYHRYSNDNGATYYPSGGWEPVYGSSASAPSVVSWGPNRLDVFVSGRPSGQISGVQHLAWTGGSWGTCGAPPCWDSLHLLAYQNGTNGPMAAPVAVTTGVGAINVFVQSIDEGLQTLAMTSSNPPAWGGFEEVATCFKTGGTAAVVSPDNTNLAVLVTGYTANNYGAVYANATSGGTQFSAAGITNPPVCSCGAPGGTCCWPDNGCNDGAVCGSSLTCACDANHVPSTAGGQAVCQEAGKLGEPCKSDGSCDDSTLGCGPSGTCMTRGTLGAPCRLDNSCNQGSTCDLKGNHTCHQAGQPGQWCYDGGTCDPGNIACNTSTNTCYVAGGGGEDCFPGGKCDKGALFCNTSNKCASCGSNGGTCCTGTNGSGVGASGNDPCGSGYMCKASKCVVSCGHANESCCGAPDPACSVAGATCVKGKCVVPPPPPPPDPANCGSSEWGSVANFCCHNKQACVSGQFCDSNNRCVPDQLPNGGGPTPCSNGAARTLMDFCATCPTNVAYYMYGYGCSEAEAQQAAEVSHPDCTVTPGPCPTP